MCDDWKLQVPLGLSSQSTIIDDKKWVIQLGRDDICLVVDSVLDKSKINLQLLN